MSVLRWVLFFLLGLPFQFLIYLVYPVIYLIARLFWQKSYKRHEKELTVVNPPENVDINFSPEYGILINSDDHNMLSQYTVCNEKSFKLFTTNTPKGLTFTRTPTVLSSPLELQDVSGDCVISFCFAATISYYFTKKPVYDLITSLATTYIKHLGCLSLDKQTHRYYVSARCNNFGINFCPDGYLKLGLPAFYPQFLTTSCLLALASYKSKYWKIVFWIHWLLLGGWYWALMPAVYPKNRYWYLRDMMMKALWIHKIIFGDRWWVNIPMKKTYESTPSVNLLFEAFFRSYQKYSEIAPDIASRFWSQNKNAASNVHDGCWMPNLKYTLQKINNQNKM